MDSYKALSALILVLTAVFAQAGWTQDKPVGSKERGASGQRRPAATKDQGFTSKSFRYSVAAPSSWILRRDISFERASAGKSFPIEYLMVDTQVSLLERTPVTYIRVAGRANDKAGIDGMTPIQIPFNPDYESLTVHSITIWRNEQKQDRLKNAKVDILQREKELERRIYDGTITALFIPEDVRVGDVIDFSYTIRGANPILGDRYAGYFLTAYNAPAKALHMRIIHPPEKKLNSRQINSPSVSLRIKEDGPVREIAFDANDTTAVVDEGDRPIWHMITPGFEVSEYESWQEVSDWAGKLFKVPTDLSPALRARIDEIRRQNPVARDQVRAALQLAQEEIRYFGVELGVSSHRPAHPNDTFERRYGDCKDKTLLLTTILRQLGVEAVPALVWARRGKLLGSVLPSPRAFDHVITRVTLDGKVYWLDATRNYQFGSIEKLGFYDFGKALPVGNASLDDVLPPEGYVNSTRSVETFRVVTGKEPVQATIETTHAGARAESMRAFVASRGFSEVSKLIGSDMVRRYPTAEMDGELTVADDKATNEFRTIEKYRIRDFLSYKSGRFTIRVDGGQVLGAIPLPKAVNRSTPFALPYPAEITDTAIVELPEPTPFRPNEPVVIRDPSFGYRSAIRAQPSRLTVDYEVRTLQDNVTAVNFGAYLEKTQRIRMNISTSLTIPVTKPPEAALDRARRAWDSASRTQRPRDISSALLASQRLVAAIEETNIESGRLNDKQAAQAYLDKAIAHSNLYEHDQALADLERALKLAPELADAYHARGVIFNKQKKWSEAIETFLTAERLSKGENPGYQERGEALYYLGRYAESVKAFDAEINIGKNRVFVAIWRYLANQRLDGTGERKLEDLLAGTDPESWPGPIARFMLGKQTEYELLKAAEHKDKNRELPQLCEAYFFIGQRYLQRNDKKRALEFFEKSIDTDIKMYREYGYANIEAERLR